MLEDFGMGRANVDHAVNVVARHLDRFAFREGELKYGWTRAWAAGGLDPKAIRLTAVH